MSHACPRRAEDPLTGNLPGPDEYKPNHGLVGQPNGCSYCGSMSPDDFMAAVRDGAELGPTDKSYKIYVKGLSTDEPDQLWIGGYATHPLDGYTAYADLTAEQRAVVDKERIADPESRYYGDFHTKPTREGKFYTQHLSPEQSNEFADLLEAGRLNIGYPGHFYRPLYLPGLALPRPTKEPTS